MTDAQLIFCDEIKAAAKHVQFVDHCQFLCWCVSFHVKFWM